ncbi:transposase [Spiroplasma ixodetis]|uniref:Transposase n=1 Tax=Spiroplasma ixodetis TaxID=2141 RepID=A0ABN7BXJ1_9MOLU
MKIKEICKVFNITRKTLFLWRKRKKETGHIKPILNYQKGHSHKIKDLDELKNYLAQNKDVTVQKVIEKFGDMTKETVYNYFKKLNYTYKKTFLYEQKDKNKQEDFLKEIAKIMNEDLVYIDESGIDYNEFYKYGWSEKGKRLFDNKAAYKIKRMSIIGSLNKGKLKALWAFEEHCNSKIFESYVKNILIPVLKRGQIIVLEVMFSNLCNLQK